MMHTQKIDPTHLEKAAELLRQGEIVAFPTETVYGLGASIFLEGAIQKIFQVKGRPSDNPLIAHICDLDSVNLIAEEIPDLFYQLAERFFPGPLTIVLPKKKEIPLLASAGLDTIAVRMPSHEIARKLIELVGSPLVAPSANLSGKPSATQVSHVLDDFGGMIAGVVLGEASAMGIESTVVRIVDGTVEILRPGALHQEELEEYLKQKVSVFASCSHIDQVLPSPGMKYRHYAPLAKVSLFFAKEEAMKAYEQNPHHKKMILANEMQNTFPLLSSSFYSFLRLADKEQYQEVLIVCDEKTLQNKGLMNRIEKAAGL